jgi:two-component system sensor histidine kinase PilS (NtrC family)
MAVISDVLPAAKDPSPDDWRVLRALCAYRLIIGPLLAGIYFSGIAPELLGGVYPGIFQIVVYAWFAAGALFLVTWMTQRPGFHTQVALHFLADTAAITLIAAASGGITSGLGMLLITPVVGYALVLSPRFAALIAALATLAVLGEELWRQLPEISDAPAFTQAGLLGLAFFVTAATASVVATRARSSEARAARVGSELLNLSRVNDTIVESMRSGVLVVDGSGRIRTINAAARQLLDLPGPVSGRPLALECPAVAEDVQAWQHRGMRRGDIITTRSGKEVTLRYTRLGRGIEAPIMVLVDDAARLRDEAQRIKLAALGRLSASIAHEIRNPLSAITHAGALLSETSTLTADDRNLLDMIQRHAGRIDRIVRDVMDLSRRQSAHAEAIRLAPFLHECSAQYGEGCGGSKRHITIRASTAPDILFDREQLRQVLYNLWDNSFEHGATTATVSADRDVNGNVIIDTRDDGPGIPEALKDQVFEPFFTTGHKGAGLGLYLARELCEYNQARLLLLPTEARQRGARFRIVAVSSGSAHA